MHSYYCLIALGRERGKKILQFLMEISQKHSLSVLLSSIVKTVNCIPIQNFPLNKEQHFSLYTSASAAPLCSTLLLSWTWMLSVPYHLLQWDYPVSQANICCKISAIYLGVSLHLDFQSLAAEAVLLHSFHHFFFVVVVVVVACKLFRAVTASCSTGNLHPFRGCSSGIEIYPDSQARATAGEGRTERAWSAIFSFLNSAAFTPVSSMFSNTNLLLWHSTEKSIWVQRSSVQFFEKRLSPWFLIIWCQHLFPFRKLGKYLLIIFLSNSRRWSKCFHQNDSQEKYLFNKHGNFC